MRKFQDWIKHGFDTALNCGEKLSCTFIFGSIILSLLAIQADNTGDKDDPQDEEDEKYLGLIALSSTALSVVMCAATWKARCQRGCQLVDEVKESGEEMQLLSPNT